MQTGNLDSRPTMNMQPNFVGPSHQDMQHKTKSKRMKPLNLNYLTSTLVILTGVLIVLIVLSLLFYKNTSENNYVNNSTYQSVDINVNGSTGGQIYFGKIVRMNSSFLVMDNVFYLQPGSSSNQYTLNSLTCTLYNPQDQIVINRSQVAFWENLSTKSQVVTDIQKWQTDKLQCSKSSDTTSTSTPTTTSSTTTPTTSNSTTSTGTTTTK
jgi:hypothetical protein